MVSQSEHLLAFSIALKGLFTSYSRVFSFNCKFESKKLMSCLDSQISLFLAKIDDKVIGASLCPYAHGVVNDMLMASLFEYWKHQPNNLILYEAILWSKKNGYNIFDLQGGRPGVFKFKKSFSKTRKTFHASSIVHNDHVYEKLCKVACEQGTGDSDFFPKYREKSSN